MVSRSACESSVSRPDSIASRPSKLSSKKTLTISSISKSSDMGSEHLGNRRQQLLGIERLDEQARGSSLFALHLFVLAGFGRQHQHRDEFVVAEQPQLAHQRNAIHARHVD